MVKTKRCVSSRSTFSFPCRSSRGLSLLELLIALLILEIAITGFAQFFMGGLDLSRKAKTSEMAQILAQNQMEKLVRTVPTDTPSFFSADQPPRLLNERPERFGESAPAGETDADSFRWIAEVAPVAHNPKLMNLSLYVYTISVQPASQSEKSLLPGQMRLLDDKRRFVYVESAADGSAEVIQGKENLRLTTAVAIP
jgi:type II secretory pathway pseudopilin PulG